MNTINTETVNGAERVLVPSGRDYSPCVEALQGMFDIEVPEFSARQLVVVSGGRTFARVKGKDIPELIAAGAADIGLTGTDVCQENIDPVYGNTAYASIGPPMCSFDLMAKAGDAGNVQRQLRGSGEAVVAITGLPRLLGTLAFEQRLNLVTAPISLSGSVEAAVQLGWATAVADIVQTGTTAEANGLAKVTSLTSIDPAVVWRDASRPYIPELSPATIRRIDTTLDARSEQIPDLTAGSYTLELLRDPNAAVKKFGSEAAEVIQASLEESALQGELETADLVYAALVLARSRRKRVSLERVLRELARRNQEPSPEYSTTNAEVTPRH